MKRTITGLVGLGLFAAAVVVPSPAAAAEAPGTEAIANGLLGGYVRIVDRDKDFARHLVGSAELLDWRHTHPQADQTALTAHFAAVDRRIEVAVRDFSSERGTNELVGTAVDAVRAAPDAVTDGAQVTSVTNALTGLEPLLRGQTAWDRLSGAQQQFGWSTALSTAQTGVWASVASTARVDAAFTGAWNTGVGNGIGVSAAASTAELAKSPPLVKLDVSGLMSISGDADAFKIQAGKTYEQIAADLYNENQEAARKLKLAADLNVAGQNKDSDEKRKADAKKDEDSRQQIIDGAKGGFDALAFVVDFYGGKEFGKQIKQFAAGAVQVANAVNKAITGYQLLNGAFSMATLTFTGNVVGAISTLVGLFADAQPTVEKQILDEVKALRQDVENLRTSMVQEFDQVNQNLDKVYTDMMQQFAVLGDDVQYVKNHVDEIGRHLTDVESQIQTIGDTLFKATAGLYQMPTWAAADKLIDYKRDHPVDPLTYDKYEDGENTFHNAGVNIAQSEDAAVIPRNETRTDPVSLRTILGLHGSGGAMAYLATYARQRFDDQFPVPGTNGNPAMWAAAANGYSLLTGQNPALATHIARGRADDVIRVGMGIKNAALSFSEPGPNGSVNKLFTGLMGNYQQSEQNLFNTVEDMQREVHPGKTYNIFDGPKQLVSTAGMEGPPKAKDCDSTNDAHSVDVPANTLGTLLLPSEQFSRYAFDAPPQYSVCLRATYIEDRVDESNSADGRVHFWNHMGHLRLMFYQYLQYPGIDRQLARYTVSEQKYDTRIQQCYKTWQNITGCDDKLDPWTVTTQEWPALKAQHEKTTIIKDSALDSQASFLNDKFLTQKKVDYYHQVGNALRGTTKANEVNDAVMLLRTYTELGFPRALGSDNNLSALLYGNHSLHANDDFTLANVYTRAGDNLAAGKTPWDSDQYEGSCQRPAGLTAKDMFAVCMAASAKIRLDRLASRYQEHFAQRWEGVDESIPAVRDGIVNLRRVIDDIYPGTDSLPAVDAPAKALPTQVWTDETRAQAGDTAAWPAVTVFNGRLYLARLGTDSAIYVSSSADGVTWGPDQRVETPDQAERTQASHAPSLAVLNGSLLLAWKDLNGVQMWLTHTEDGTNWAGSSQIAPDGGTSDSVAIAVLNGKIYAVWKGIADDGGIYSSASADGARWDPQRKINGTDLTTNGPSLTVFNGKLVVAKRAPDSKMTTMTSADGITWSGWNRLAPDGASATGASVAAANGKLYAVWKGYDTDTGMYLATSDDAVTWTPQVHVTRHSGTAARPTIVDFRGQRLLVWTGLGNQVMTAASNG